MPKTITLENESFEFVIMQRNGRTGVYRGAHTYARVGPREDIERHTSAHRALATHAFPVPRLVREGTCDYGVYVIEEALTGVKIGKVFRDDWVERGFISDEHFEMFLDVMRQCTRAQLDHPIADRESALRAGIFLDELTTELPAHAEALERVFAEAESRFHELPLTLLHGDLNPQNMFADGVIDFEDAFVGPLGYDQVSAIASINWFPDGEEYEFFARYRFSQEQIARYYTAMDALFHEAGVPRLSEVARDFEFCRSVWSTVRMHEWPRIQEWRYQKLINTYLSR